MSPSIRLSAKHARALLRVYTDWFGNFEREEQAAFELATRFGVHPSAISFVLSGKTWRHVQ